MFWMVIITSALVGVGLLRLTGASQLELDAPSWAPSVSTARWMSLLAFLSATWGIGLAVATGTRSSLIGGLWIASLLLHWVWVRMVLTPRLSAAFTMHNVAWVATFLAAGAAWASSSLGGYLTVPLLIWLIFLGGVTFFLWQINQPSQRR